MMDTQVLIVNIKAPLLAQQNYNRKT